MSRIVGALIDRILVVAGAVTCAQAPAFFHAYTQRLGGHMAELRIQTGSLRAAAEQSGRSLEQYVDKFLHHADRDIATQGEFMQSMITRFQVITDAYQSMVDATALSRPLHFVKTFQFDVAKMTFHDFQFGLTFTAETFAYALVGMGIGYAAYRIVKSLFSFTRKVAVR